ncbi:hypothetical protein G6321_00020420 [Bradyrhizobium barranii subsp. barranii]|uniref:Uncharacterized protein n=1 Tax=Bradyrhizobium barranii subsp. barranii TaxID=2823807 RepID=A0A9X9Z2F5_9BRAD|nr:hypothetical protein [Bradyrhizobium barranii]UGX97360.1 hypothetical protein G6321_00020420 [Bradyrhizobium barranii subsp. barranii]
MGNFNRALRRNESFIKLSTYLTQHGYSFEPSMAGKHPYVVVQLGEGKTVKFFFPSSAGDRRSADRQLRVADQARDPPTSSEQ